jgi:rSAM-associated Gly-rich repeat protein
VPAKRGEGEGVTLLRQKYLNILAGLLPAGALGVSLALSTTTALATVDPEPTGGQPPAASQSRVSDRLAAIRDAVSAIEGAKASKPDEQVAWWAWRNGGGGWRNGGAAWRNGGGGWGGGGWRNGGGGWRNGGWRNGPWSNFWRNF